MIFNKSVKHRYLTFKLIRWVSSLSNCMLYSSTNKLLFTRKLDFFNIRGVRFGIVRTSMRLTHLASFQAKEFMYSPNRSGNDRHLIRLVLSEAFSTKHGILVLFTKREHHYEADAILMSSFDALRWSWPHFCWPRKTDVSCFESRRFWYWYSNILFNSFLSIKASFGHTASIRQECKCIPK